MELTRLRTALDADFARLQEVAAGANLDARVPSCPDWSLAELIDHVAMVYLHKVLTMSVGEFDWPPALADGKPPPLDFLTDTYRRLLEQFDAHDPRDHSKTWYEPDQTVGFWIRRMAQETVIHRVDAELAAGAPLAPISEDLGIDGIDEVLKIFLAYGSREYNEMFDLKAADGAATLIIAGGRTWLVRPTPSAVLVTDGADTTAVEVIDGADTTAVEVIDGADTTAVEVIDGADTTAVVVGDGAAATVSGRPQDVLLWLWRRAGDDAISVSGNEAVAARLRDHLQVATQ